MIAHDPTAALPTGTTVLEASAGTGKTYAIAALATRYLAEGVVEVEHLAVISFSRFASAELRSRVRERLESSVAALTAHRAGKAVQLEPTDAFLADAPDDEVLARIARLHRALAGLDAAAIMTIHQFCQAMLDELGVLAAQDAQARLVEDTAALREQVVEDLYLARYAEASAGPPFDLATARQLAKAADELSEAVLVPSGAGGLAAERVAFAHAVRDELAARKAKLGLFSFDDQLSRLRDALQGPTAAAAKARLRRRCRVVLVDEFQDTDPVQWQILRETFSGHGPLVLIGDPKQSIYAFRGADVTAYTDAVTGAEQRSLLVNYRADAGLVAGVNALFEGVTLGAGIPVPPVSAHHQQARLQAPGGSNWDVPLRLRCVATETPSTAAVSRATIVADLTSQVVGLLDSGTTVQEDGRWRAVSARDIAILVSRNDRGRQIADALTAAGVPVAFSGADSIFASHAAADWLDVLLALEQPRNAQVRAAILTDFVGADLSALASADEDQLVAWAGLLQSWARVLATHGVAALYAAIQSGDGVVSTGFAERVLRRPRGERDLTDFRHVAEILHAAHADGIRGHALVAWLQEAIAGSTAASDRIRRLETDRDAVAIMTVHKAKGLQFPIVFLPEAADLWVPDEDGGLPIAFHSEGRRVLDVGGTTAAGRPERRAANATEEAEDRLRALYVALTRAESQVTLWWSRTRANTASSPLHRLLFRRRDLPGPPQECYPLDCPPGDGHPRDLAWLAAAGILVEDCAPATEANWRRPAPTSTHLRLQGLGREIDQLWRRTSYSGLTEAVHARAPLPVEAPLSDEPHVSTEAGPAEVGPSPLSPMAALPGGTGFGSLVHEVFEQLDWHTADSDELHNRLLAATTAALARFAVPGVTASDLAQALLPSLRTPLGSLTDGRALADIPIHDRLSELSFEFALGDPSGTASLADVAAVLRRWLPADDALAGYPEALADPALSAQVLRGFLTGSIDSVLRIPGVNGPRFVVVDYKTNRLGPDELTLAHYDRTAMTAEMIRTHYPLQAILYCVALHRFLSARLPGYRPEIHLGGVGYLFVRGMGGSEAGPATGVFDWFPPAGLVVELSTLLATGRRR